MKKIKKIALVGTSPSSNLEAPYDDPEWEIWNLGSNFQLGKRFDRWFELHEIEYLQELKMIPAQFEFYKECKDKLWIREAREGYPDANVYPKEQVLEKFNSYFVNGDYFTSSVPWMLALAIEEGAAHIGLWGIDLVVGEERINQKCCLEFFIGLAAGLGIEVTVPRVSTLCRGSHLYGFESPKLLDDVSLRLVEVNADIAQKEAAVRKAEKEYAYVKGVSDNLNDMKKRWS